MGPAWTISLPIASSSGFARSNASSLPPAMIVSVPSCARGEEPVTGVGKLELTRVEQPDGDDLVTFGEAQKRLLPPRLADEIGDQHDE